MKKIYWFYRRERISNKSFWDVNLNWWYTISFYVNEQYSDWINAWLISIKDCEIPSERYIKELIPWVKDLREFVYMEYNDAIINEELAKIVINKIWARFDLEILTLEWAKKFLREHTNLKEIEEWKFELNERYELLWEAVEAKYITIS